MVNRNFKSRQKWPRSGGNSRPSCQSPQATCQFPMQGLMKNVLTVTGSGCVALGHPARPPKWLPETREPGRTPLRTPVSNSCGAKWRQRRRNEQATPIPSRKKTAGASRVTRVPAADIAAGQVSRRCREQAKEIAAAPGAAAPSVWSSCSRRKSSREKPSQRKPRFDRVGAATFPRSPAVRSTPTRRARSPRSVPFTDNRAGPRLPVADAARSERHAGPS